jgi:hypothetical protein
MAPHSLQVRTRPTHQPRWLTRRDWGDQKGEPTLPRLRKKCTTLDLRQNDPKKINGAMHPDTWDIEQLRNFYPYYPFSYTLLLSL